MLFHLSASAPGALGHELLTLRQTGAGCLIGLHAHLLKQILSILIYVFAHLLPAPGLAGLEAAFCR